MDKISLERIEKAHPQIREELKALYIEANNQLGKGVRLRFAYVFRTPEEQDKLYNQRPKVTNAKAWQSIHNYGLAFDIVILYDKNLDGNFEEASWSLIKDLDKDGIADFMEVVKFFKSKGWSWGGDWKGFTDNPHFEKTFGNTWRTLQAKIVAGHFTMENGIKYPIL